MSARICEFGPFRLDADKSVVWHGGVTVASLRRILPSGVPWS